MFFRTGNVGKIVRTGIFLSQVTGDIAETFEGMFPFRPEQNSVADLLDNNFRAFKSESLGKTYRLTTAALE
jgi:hypothetical protein